MGTINCILDLIHNLLYNPDMKLRYALLFTVAVLFVLGIFVYRKENSRKVTPTQVSVVSEKKATPAPTVDEFYVLINAERAKVGVKPLVIDGRVNASAQRKSDEMIAENKLDHINNAGVHGYTYIPYKELGCTNGSENLAETDTTRSAVERWMKSKEHREALLNPRYDFTGFGIAKLEGFNIYRVTEHFCDVE